MSLLQQAQDACAKYEAEKPQREAAKLERQKTFFAQRFLKQYGFECGAIELLGHNSFVTNGVRFGYDATWGLHVRSTCPACGKDFNIGGATNIYELCSALERRDAAIVCADCKDKKGKRTWRERIFEWKNKDSTQSI